MAILLLQVLGFFTLKIKHFGRKESKRPNIFRRMGKFFVLLLSG